MRKYFDNINFFGRLMLGATAVGLIFVAGWFSGAAWFKAEMRLPKKTEIRLGQTGFGYQFINPLLACQGAQETIEDQHLRTFESKVRSFIAQRNKAGVTSSVSAYFREMNNGLAFSVNEDETFSPASLLKVPDMIAYFKWIEQDPRAAKRKVTFAGFPDLNFMQNFQPTEKMTYGADYSMLDLVRRSVEYSDNNAEYLIQKTLPAAVRNKVYTDLGLEPPLARGADAAISIDDYASFFEVLFNASYLSREQSEQALKLLSAPDFPVGITAGVPPTVLIAQKFGERVMGDHAEIKQLHDCGIVYYPNHPYLLCIMTKGPAFEPLVDTIRELSRLTYEQVDRQYHAK
jgi:beta-lactamase class A